MVGLEEQKRYPYDLDTPTENGIHCSNYSHGLRMGIIFDEPSLPKDNMGRRMEAMRRLTGEPERMTFPVS